MPENEVEYKTTEQLVRNILAMDERSRNDDKWLTYNVIQILAKAQGKSIFIPFELFKDFPSYETISRVRRKIQHKEGLYKPTSPEVLEKREGREQFVKAWAVQA